MSTSGPVTRRPSQPNLAQPISTSPSVPRFSNSPQPQPTQQPQQPLPKRSSNNNLNGTLNTSSNGTAHQQQPQIQRPSSGQAAKSQAQQYVSSPVDYQPSQPQFESPSTPSKGSTSARRSVQRPTIDTSYQPQLPPGQHLPPNPNVNGGQQPQQQAYYQTAPPAVNINDPYYANAPGRESLYNSVSSRRSQMTLPMSASVVGQDGKFDDKRSSTLPGPLLDQSHLRPGKSASLLTHDRTLELYRDNAKKTNDPELMFEFAVFMIDAAKSMVPSDDSATPSDPSTPTTTPFPGQTQSVQPRQNPNVLTDKRDELYKEATALLKKLADKGYPDAQYFLADCYSNGIGTVRGKQDFDRAFPLFVLAAKHGHPDACYRAGMCCENGWGCRRENAKAIQFYKKAAVALHPGAMYRLGTAELNGNMGLTRSPKEGYKWLKRSAEHATEEYPHALHELALLHERGIDNVVFVDHDYSAELLAQASELGYAPSAFKLGECYEYGKMDCPVDPALSIHYYNIAATQNHPDACFALTAWYLVGSPGVLPQSDTEAYLWAKKAAEAGLAKAQYAVGYFTETGIGIEADLNSAMVWYKQAADAGDKRATKRIQTGSRSKALDRRLEIEAMKDSGVKGGKDKGENCIIM